MPRLNDNGQPTTGYGTCWFNNERIIKQDCSTGTCRIVLSDGTLIKETYCSNLFAKHGVWAAFQANKPPEIPSLVFGSFDGVNEFEISGASLASGSSPVASDLISPDGAICIKDKYFSFGPWHVHESNGDIWKLTDGDAHSIQLLGNKKAIYLIGNQLFKTNNLELTIPNRLMWWPRVTLINGKYLLSYQDFNTGQLVLDNKVIGPSDSYFRHDKIWINNKIKVVWSPDEGESIVKERILSLEELDSLPNITEIVEPPIELPPNTMITSPLKIHSSNRLFERDGHVHRVKSVTAFKLLHLFSQGQDIEPFLNTFKRSNELRILSSTDGPNSPWGSEAWPLPSATMVREFCEYVGQRNFDVEFTCITGNQPEKISALKNIIEYLGFRKVKNVTLELTNEPQFNKSDPHLLEESAKASGLLYSSGIYHDNNQFFGNFINYHSARDGEWVRKFHDALEYWDGKGPNFPAEKALKVPSKADEPIRPDQAAFNELDFYTYGAGVGLFSAGGCFHFQSGKFGQLPTKDELNCYHAFMDGLELFPSDAVLGNYFRPLDNSLRTYIVGPYMIRVRPTSSNPPDPSFHPVDTFNICYTQVPIPIEPSPIEDEDMPKHTYDEMMVLVDKMNQVTKTTKLGELSVVKDLDMYPIRTTAHLLWRYFFENHTDEALLDETRKRGNGESV